MTQDSINPSNNENKSFLNKYTTTIAMTLLLVLIIAIVGSLSLSSMPGEKLYNVKINGVEKFLSLLHLSNKSKAQYQVTLLQNRLEEAKVLAAQTTISENTLAVLTSQTTLHSETFTQLISQSIDSAFSKTEVLTTVNEFATIATAIENIAENNTFFGTFGDTAEDIRQDAVNLYKEKANSFAATENPNDIYIFIGTRLTEVTKALEETTLNADTSESVELYLDRVEPALAEKDLGKVLIVIAEAERFIKIVPLGGEDILDAIAYPQQNATSTLEVNTNATTSTASSTL